VATGREKQERERYRRFTHRGKTLRAIKTPGFIFDVKQRRRNCLILNGTPYRRRYKHITTYKITTLIKVIKQYTPKNTPIYFCD
jgi:hypothetical protein